MSLELGKETLFSIQTGIYFLLLKRYHQLWPSWPGSNPTEGCRSCKEVDWFIFLVFTCKEAEWFEVLVFTCKEVDWFAVLVFICISGCKVLVIKFIRSLLSQGICHPFIFVPVLFYFMEDLIILIRRIKLSLQTQHLKIHKKLVLFSKIKNRIS